MKTFDDLWQELVRLQPRLANGSEQITFRVDSFRMLMNKAFQRGRAVEVLKRDQSGIGPLVDSIKEGL